MQSITNNIARIAGVALAAFAMLAVAIAVAPSAHAADLGFDEYSGGGGYFDQWSGGNGYYDQYSGGNGYYDQYSGGNGYFDQYSGGNGYTDQYSGGNPSYDYGSGSGFGGGCSSCGGGFGGSGFGGFGGFGGGGTIVAPSSASSNTSIYSPTNTCTAPNSCNSSVDDHSIFNAPIVITNPNNNQGTPVQPVYPQYPVYNGYPMYQQPVVYPNPVRQPYVSLSAAPYTGLDLGPVGTALYWGFLVAWCLVAAYLIVYKRVQTKLVSGLNSFLFGAPATVGTHAKVVMPAKASVTRTLAPAAKNDDAIDPFIASQIARNK